MDAGRCLFRDHSGRVEAIQVELAGQGLLRAFSTTPGVRAGDEGAPGLAADAP
jgi:hypothetical protein